MQEEWKEKGIDRLKGVAAQIMLQRREEGNRKEEDC